MHFYIDENIPYANEFFSDLGKITRFAGRELSSEHIADADVLLVRSITKVNQALLSQAKKLKFVGTATIGEDHIDKPLLKQYGIQFSSAPGCNAISVAEYVISALYTLAEKYNFELRDKTLGIVGVGNIGKALKSKMAGLGVELLLNDPLRQETEQSDEFVDLDYLLQHSDMVSFHTPKTMEGPHATYHLLNEDNMALLKSDVVLVNASRGEVIDNQALLAEVKRREQKGEVAIKLVLDVWENEPTPLPELIEYCDIATAHIAGYSLEGKARGTEILYQQVCKTFGLDASKQLANLLPKHSISELVFEQAPQSQEQVKALLHLIYDPRRDDALFRQLLEIQGFDWLRKNYPVRREWSSLPVKFIRQSNCSDQKAINFLQLGFDI